MTYERAISTSRSMTRRCIVAGLTSLLTFGSGAVLAQDGIIGVNGAIANSSCSISTTPVNLGDHPASSFTNIGTATAWVDVDITSQGCSADIVTLHMGFDGDADPDNKNLFAVAPNGARGIGIELQTADGMFTVIPNSTTDLVDWNPLPTGDIYRMRARYVSTLRPVTPGAADSTVTVMLSYN